MDRYDHVVRYIGAGEYTSEMTSDADGDWILASDADEAEAIANEAMVKGLAECERLSSEADFHRHIVESACRVHGRLLVASGDLLAALDSGEGVEEAKERLRVVLG